MKLVKTIDLKGHFDDGKPWTARRAICIDTFNGKGGTNETLKILKIPADITLPDGEFTPLYDEHGRVADIKK